MLENVRVMRTPKPAQLKAPILEILAEGKTWQFMEIVDCPVWVALRSVPLGMSATLPLRRGIKQTGTGTPHENDSAFLDTLRCYRDAGTR